MTRAHRPPRPAGDLPPEPHREPGILAELRMTSVGAATWLLLVHLYVRQLRAAPGGA